MAVVVEPSLVCSEQLAPQLSCPGASEVDALRPRNSSVSILAPVVGTALGGLKKTYSGSCRVPVVGRFARFGVAATDACLSRVTPWSGCAEVGEQLDSLAMYLDKEFLTTVVAGKRVEKVPEPSELSFAARRSLFDSPDCRGGTKIFAIGSPVSNGKNIDFHFFGTSTRLCDPQDDSYSSTSAGCTRSRSSSMSSELEHGLGAAVAASEEDLEAMRLELQALCEEFSRQSAPDEALDADAVSDASIGGVSSRRIVAPLVGTTLGGLKMVYLGSCSLPVVGRFARLGVSAADACLSRVTPWSGCGEVGDQLTRLAAYLDKGVLTPQNFSDGVLSKLPLVAWRSVFESMRSKAPEPLPSKSAQIIANSDHKNGESYFIGDSVSAEPESGPGQTAAVAFEALKSELQSLCQQSSRQGSLDELIPEKVDAPAEM